MKKLIIISMLFLLTAVNYLQAQDIKVQNFIGKPINDVIANYGNPVHQDTSIPEMVSTFFKMPNRNYIFVSDSSGVYQAQASLNYNTKEEAADALTKFIKDCQTNTFTSDTLSSEHIKLHKRGEKIDVNLFQMGNGKAQIKIEAAKTED